MEKKKRDKKLIKVIKIFNNTFKTLDLIYLICSKATTTELHSFSSKHYVFIKTGHVQVYRASCNKFGGF